MNHSAWPQEPPPWIMGILNVTPDSFSDGGRFLDPDSAIEHARRMIAEGAHIIDIGGESTRPGAESVPADEQIRRVIPVVEAIRRMWKGPLSIDTTRAAVAEAALEAGASWINDISALRDDDRLGEVIARRGCRVILMHMQGAPRTMQENPHYDDVARGVRDFLSERAAFAQSLGISHENIIIDPGIGFGKTHEHNLTLLRRLPEIVELGYPVLVGVSRKSFIGQITGASTEDRLPGSLAAAIHCVAAGAKIVRVHDVAATRQAVVVYTALTLSNR